MKDWNETYVSFLTADTRKDGKQGGGGGGGGGRDRDHMRQMHTDTGENCIPG